MPKYITTMRYSPGSCAYKKVETQELLTQEQLLETLDLARDAAEVFEVPGQQG